MNLGTNDKKKVGILVGLVLVAAYFLLTDSDTPRPAPARPAAAPSADMADAPPPAAASPSPSTGPSGAPKRAGTVGRGRSEEFHPVLRSKRQDERIDVTNVDPTLKLGLLARLQQVEPSAGRNLFQFGAPPPPPKETAALKGPEPIVRPFVGPKKPVEPPPPAPKVDPPPPPIPYKYYGYTVARDNGKKTAFFLDGEEILLASEGQTVKRRYRVVRIGTNSVVMEDVDSKKQQTLPIAEEAAS